MWCGDEVGGLFWLVGSIGRWIFCGVGKCCGWGKEE